MNRKTIFRYPQIALCIAACALAGCVHDAITLPDGPGGAIAGVDSTGVTFTTPGEALWISEGVPASWFSPARHLTNLQWHAGNQIRLRRVNP